MCTSKRITQRLKLEKGQHAFKLFQAETIVKEKDVEDAFEHEKRA